MINLESWCLATQFPSPKPTNSNSDTHTHTKQTTEPSNRKYIISGCHDCYMLVFFYCFISSNWSHWLMLYSKTETISAHNWTAKLFNRSNARMLRTKPVLLLSCHSSGFYCRCCCVLVFLMWFSNSLAIFCEMQFYGWMKNNGKSENTRNLNANRPYFVQLLFFFFIQFSLILFAI